MINLHFIIAKIIKCRSIDEDIKQMAIDEIDLMISSKTYANIVAFNPDLARDLFELFIWDKSSLGANFWKIIHEQIIKENGTID